MSRDVAFDEMSSWYARVKMIEDVDESSDSVVQDVDQQSQVLSGPRESSNNGCNISPWTRGEMGSNRGRMSARIKSLRG